MNGRDRDTPDQVLTCKTWRKDSPIKSTKAIAEETDQIGRYLEPPVEPGCPKSGCSNANVGLYSFPGTCVCKGKRRVLRHMKCKACGNTFFQRERSFAGQKKPLENTTGFKEIVSRKPLRSIVHMTELSPKAVYDKIDFICRRCLGRCR